MSTPWVIDASIAVSWAHPDQSTQESERVFAELASGATISVPPLWFVESANCLLILQRRKKMTAADRKAALNMLGNLPLEIDYVSPRAAFEEVSVLAEKHLLTVYDATYLELALRKNLALATRDEQLRIAAKRCGVAVL